VQIIIEKETFDCVTLKKDFIFLAKNRGIFSNRSQLAIRAQQ